MLSVLVILFLSIVPMVVYAVLLWWLDRYEKEPLHLLTFAVFWGAVPSIILSLILELAVGVPILAAGLSPLATDLLGSALTAPLVEEGTKALALVGLVVLFTRELDSPLDGLIYGGMVGFGFATVENFFYFLAAYLEQGMAGLLILGFLRAGLFGLNHAMFTAFTGLGLALALQVKGLGWKLLLPPVGFALSVGAHAFHNAFATFWGYQEGHGSLLAAIAGDWGGVLLLLTVAVWARVTEQQQISDFLESPAGRRFIPESEKALLTSPLRRWLARAGALLSADVSRWWYLGRYFQLVSEAAFNWHRSQRGDAKSGEKLARIEEKIRTLRKMKLPHVISSAR